MTHITELHGLQEPTTATVCRRPWTALRLVDLDDLETEQGGMAGADGTVNAKALANHEYTTGGSHLAPVS